MLDHQNSFVVLVRVLLASTLIFILLGPSNSNAQPLCLPIDSLDYIVVGKYDVIRARIKSIDTIREHPQIREITVEVLETIRGDEAAQVKFVYDAASVSNVESMWPQQLLDSRKEMLLFLAKTPWSYPFGTTSRN